jgi:hypothetical protein
MGGGGGIRAVLRAVSVAHVLESVCVRENLRESERERENQREESERVKGGGRSREQDEEEKEIGQEG